MTVKRRLRFFIPQNDIISHTGLTENFVIIFDYIWYMDNHIEISDFLDTCCPGWNISGMCLSFTDSISMEAFLLRFQN